MTCRKCIYYTNANILNCRLKKISNPKECPHFSETDTDKQRTRIFFKKEGRK
jgi:hypothetical protein